MSLFRQQEFEVPSEENNDSYREQRLFQFKDEMIFILKTLKLVYYVITENDQIVPPIASWLGLVQFGKQKLQVYFRLDYFLVRVLVHQTQFDNFCTAWSISNFEFRHAKITFLMSSQIAQCNDSDFLSVRYRVQFQPGPSIHGVSVVDMRLRALLTLYAAPGRLYQMNGKL